MLLADAIVHESCSLIDFQYMPISGEPKKTPPTTYTGQEHANIKNLQTFPTLYT